MSYQMQQLLILQNDSMIILNNKLTENTIQFSNKLNNASNNQDTNIYKYNEKYSQNLLDYSQNLLQTLQNNITTLQSLINDQKILIEQNILSNTTFQNSLLSANITDSKSKLDYDYRELDTQIFNNVSNTKNNLQQITSTANQNLLNSYQKTEQNTIRNMTRTQNTVTQNYNDLNFRIDRVRNQFDVNISNVNNQFNAQLQYVRNYIDSTYMKKRDVKPPKPVCNGRDQFCAGQCCTFIIEPTQIPPGASVVQCGYAGQMYISRGDVCQACTGWRCLIGKVN
ncbi:Hypothetical_protein [Hexamita inflata]|uniref:Hypothetical_protein n=1 Tax=Hexamita inflata TaxID=28002 RepID=A0ABP1I729_9EUKA